MLNVIIFIFSFIIVFPGCTQTFNIDSLRRPDVKFSELIHDFGNVKEGDMLTWILKFKNTGNDTLKILDVRTTCGCTVPEWDSTKIYLPGEDGQIKIILNTLNKASLYNKPFFVFSNALNKMTGITIRANILKRRSLKIFKNRNKH